MTANNREDGKFDVTIKIEAQKFRADEKGEETGIPIDDYVNLGAFAAPESVTVRLCTASV